MGVIADISQVKAAGWELKLRGGSLADACHHRLLHCFFIQE